MARPLKYAFDPPALPFQMIRGGRDLPGKSIEVVPSGESSQPLQITYREGMSRFTAMDNAVKTNRAERTGKPAPQPPATPTPAPKKKTHRPAKKT